MGEFDGSLTLLGECNAYETGILESSISYDLKAVGEFDRTKRIFEESFFPDFRKYASILKTYTSYTVDS